MNGKEINRLIAASALAISLHGQPQQADGWVKCGPFDTSASDTPQSYLASFDGPAGECNLDLDSLNNSAMGQAVNQIIEEQKEAGYNLESIIRIQEGTGNFALISLNDRMEASLKIGFYDTENQSYKISDVEIGTDSQNPTVARYLSEEGVWVKDEPIFAAPFLLADENDTIGHQYFGIFSQNSEAGVDVKLLSMPQSTQIIRSGLHSYEIGDRNFFEFDVNFPGVIKTYTVDAATGGAFAILKSVE